MAVMGVIRVSKVDNLRKCVYLAIGVLWVVDVGRHHVLHSVRLGRRKRHAVCANERRLECRRRLYDSEHADVNLIRNHGFSVLNLRPGSCYCNRAAAVIANAAVILGDLDFGAGFDLQFADGYSLLTNDESHFLVGDGQCLGDNGLTLESSARL